MYSDDQLIKMRDRGLPTTKADVTHWIRRSLEGSAEKLPYSIHCNVCGLPLEATPDAIDFPKSAIYCSTGRWDTKSSQWETVKGCGEKWFYHEITENPPFFTTPYVAEEEDLFILEEGSNGLALYSFTRPMTYNEISAYYQKQLRGHRAKF